MPALSPEKYMYKEVTIMIIKDTKIQRNSNCKYIVGIRAE